jgi:hypothetical protein
MEAAESLALLLSGAKALVWETPTADIVKAKKTCKNSHIWLELERIKAVIHGDERKEPNSTLKTSPNVAFPCCTRTEPM